MLEPAPVMTVEGQSYTVSEYYLEDLKPLGEVGRISLMPNHTFVSIIVHILYIWMLVPVIHSV